MQDAMGRNINYLRLSITDRCDLRCKYCMPPQGIVKRPHSEILSVEETLSIVRAAADLGITKIRVTGGEPLVRRGVLALCRGIAQTPGIAELCLTTNGQRLAVMAKDLRAAGIGRLNLSLDTLRANRYADMTRGGDIRQVFAGIQAAQEAGFPPLKINVVLIGGYNIDEIPVFIDWTKEADIQVRFIELMPLGECADWERERFVSAEEVLRQVPALQPLSAQGVARIYQVPRHRGTVGLIRPLSQHFCKGCNRLRLTADGNLKPCLHSNMEIPIRGLNPVQLRSRLKEAIASKPEQHHLDCGGGSETGRAMHQIGG